MGERILLDTFFVQALLNRRDQYHARAQALSPRLRTAKEVWIAEAILIEIGNALSAINRAGAVEFIRGCYHTRNVRVVPVDTELLKRAIEMYAARRDKDRGLMDCISFIVMQEQRLSDAFTGDVHFRQAGFRAIMLDER